MSDQTNYADNDLGTFFTIIDFEHVALVLRKNWKYLCGYCLQRSEYLRRTSEAVLASVGRQCLKNTPKALQSSYCMCVLVKHRI